MTTKEIKIEQKPSNKLFQDLEGNTYERLVVIGYAGKLKNISYWWCRCECGNISRVYGGDLKSKRIVSCGCHKREVSTRHGFDSHPLYHIFIGAKSRCENPNNQSYEDYGGRGIKFHFNNPEELLQEIGNRPSQEYSIERIDNDGHYEPGNVKWATNHEQARNHRRNHLISFNGETKCLVDWGRELGFKKPENLLDRMNKGGWCLECTLTVKVRGKPCPHR